MDRRRFILAFAAGTALLGASPMYAERGDPSAVEFVERLYQKQARLQVQDAPLGQDDFLPLFSKEMSALMRAPRRTGRNVTLGPVLNAFFGWGVLPRIEVTVGKVSHVPGEGEGQAKVSVPLSYRGQTHKVLIHVVLETNRWRIANIFYDSGKSLLDHYREITAR